MILIALICIFIGYIFSKKYKTRSNFFQALLYLCQKFDIEINYSRERLKNIFLNLDDKYKKDLKGIDSNYIAFIDKESPLDKDSLFKNMTFLKDSEKELIFSFFKTLGRSDVDSQSKEIKNFVRFAAFIVINPKCAQRSKKSCASPGRACCFRIRFLRCRMRRR